MRRCAAAAAVLLVLAAPARARAQEHLPDERLPDFPGIGWATLAAEDTGYEYVNVLRDAWDRTYEGADEALSVLFGLTAVFDDEAARAHAGVLAALLEHRGDAAFAGMLAKEPPRTRASVLRAVEASGHALDWRAFPRTAALRASAGSGG